MYRVSVSRTFGAEHYLTVPNPGAEGEPHSHEYRLAIEFAGAELDEHGYLVDIDDVESALDTIESRYAGAMLNDLPEFRDQNPSLERFATQIAARIGAAADWAGAETLTVTLWEAEHTWASYRHDLAGGG